MGQKGWYDEIKSIIKNYACNLIFKMLDLLVYLLTASILARILGKIGVGIYAYMNSIATFFILLVLTKNRICG